jgi:hypothetical protein
MSEDDDRKAAEAAELERIFKGPSAEEWAASKARVQAREKAERERLFGDKEPFAIPDTEADS